MPPAPTAAPARSLVADMPAVLRDDLTCEDCKQRPTRLHADVTFTREFRWDNDEPHLTEAGYTGHELAAQVVCGCGERPVEPNRALRRLLDLLDRQMGATAAAVRDGTAVFRNGRSR